MIDPWKDNPIQENKVAAFSTSTFIKNVGWALFSFKGRLSLSGIWIFVAAQMIGGLCFMVYSVKTNPTVDSYPILFPYSLVFIWIMGAVFAKRFHDLGKSGWWALLFLIPILNIWAFIMCFFFNGAGELNIYDREYTNKNA